MTAELRASLAQVQELKPCPWCGEKLTGVSVSEGSTFRWRKVDGCCTDGPEVRHDTMADDQAAAEIDSTRRAIEAWNTRHGAGDAEDAARWRAFKNGSGRPFGTDYVVRQFSRTYGEEEPVSWSDFERAMDERVAARAGERGVA